MKIKIIIPNTYFRKGEVLHVNKLNQVVKVIKIYDRVWWRKLLIKWSFIAPTHKLKVTNKW